MAFIEDNRDDAARITRDPREIATREVLPKVLPYLTGWEQQAAQQQIEEFNGKES